MHQMSNKTIAKSYDENKNKLSAIKSKHVFMLYTKVTIEFRLNSNSSLDQICQKKLNG